MKHYFCLKDIGRRIRYIISKCFSYVRNHTSNGAPAKVGTLLKNEILNNFKNLLKLKSRGYNVFFTDIDKIKKQMIKELDNSNKQKIS